GASSSSPSTTNTACPLITAAPDKPGDGSGSLEQSAKVVVVGDLRCMLIGLRRSGTASALGVAAAVVFIATPPVAADASAMMRQGAMTAASKTVKCSASQVLVTVKGKARCRSLPTSAGAGGQRLAFLDAVISRDPVAVRTRSGKRVASFWGTAGGRL